MDRFKVRQVMSILDIKKSRIQYYVDMGIIDPVEDSRGPGTDRYFSKRNIAEIRLAQTLTKLGVGIKTNRTIVQELISSGDDFKDEIGELIGAEGKTFSCITPHTPDLYDGTAFLKITFSTPEDLTPHVEVFYANVPNAHHKVVRNPEDTSHMLLVNLTRIKKDVEAALEKQA
jgi:DNA-binding transcriptional MerR regulator